MGVGQQTRQTSEAQSSRRAFVINLVSSRGPDPSRLVQDEPSRDFGSQTLAYTRSILAPVAFGISQYVCARRRIAPRGVVESCSPSCGPLRVVIGTGVSVLWFTWLAFGSGRVCAWQGFVIIFASVGNHFSFAEFDQTQTQTPNPNPNPLLLGGRFAACHGMTKRNELLQIRCLQRSDLLHDIVRRHETSSCKIRSP